jgi:phosphorylcholine metabolism protein LicD
MAQRKPANSLSPNPPSFLPPSSLHPFLPPPRIPESILTQIAQSPQQFHSHYDGRFASSALPDTERRKHLVMLGQSYLSSMKDIGAQTWIMHGTLLGWWWNRKVMPWDSDLDVQMSEASMRYLAAYYNMTLHHYRIRDGRNAGKHYLLEINPNHVNGSVGDTLNVIDARWIDTDTGLFIDITSVRRNDDIPSAVLYGELMCKDKHFYRQKDLFPLRHSTFEGVPVMVPNSYTTLLEKEYGAQSMTVSDFAGHHFDSKSMEWIPHE